MAELVAGAFLSSFFQAIFDRLASSNLTDYFRRGKLDKLVEELESTLDSINQVLDDAEIKQYQFPNVKKWLGDVKHAMYEADQLLDEIATDAPLKKMRADSQPTTSSSNNYFGYVSAFINPFESRIKELLKNLKHHADQKDVLELKNGSLARNEFGVGSKPLERPQTSYLVDASQIYGRDDEKNEMVKFLLSNNDSGNQTPISSIVGLGGMGKTTFAKLVYNDSRIKECFELKAWVYVSESFDVVGLTKAILKSFHSPSDDESTFNLLQERLQHVLTGKKYLLVLDDIWNRNAECWEQLLLPFNHGSYGSKIIVTTRDNEVANVLKSTKVFYLQKLDQSNCWDLFVTHAFHGKNVNENLNLESIGKKIVEKCGGLPLAVKTMGQLLRKKFSQHEWMKILETDLWRLSDGNNNINPVLRLSYHNLPSNQKCCFAFCSIFPKGYRFQKGELINLWMAEGLLKCCRTEKSEKELGNEIFGDLKSISFFQQSTYSNLFDMHDLVSDLAKSVSGEFCMRIEEAEVEVIPDRIRHVGLSFQLDFVNKLREPICEFKGLRSLILCRGWGTSISNSVQRDIFSRLKYLRMLSFYGCRLSELVDEICNLKLLRYLDLSWTRISRLPDTICMLCNLQTLLLSECDKLTELPSNFSKLINLRHLELPYSIKKMPKNIGSLSNLQMLDYFIVEEQSGSDLKELEKLNHLRGTIQITGLGKVIDPTDVTTRSLKDKKYLKEIEIIFDDGSEDMDGDDGDGRSEDMDGTIVERNAESVLEALQPNSNLQMLTITKYRGNNFPNWLNGSHLSPPEQLTSLKELSISKCHGIKIFGNDSTNVPFKFLEVLKFENMKNWKEWLCMEGFPRLKELSIIDCPKLKSVLPQHIPSLQKLVIHDCPKLKGALPQHLPSLQKLVINYCPKLKGALPQHLPSLQKLEINYCEMLDVSVPNGNNIIDIDIQGCGRILINKLSPSLKAFVLRGNQYVEFSMDHLINCPFLETLELDIWSCGRILINELSPSLKRFVIRGNQYVEFSMDHLINCPFLETLELDLKDTVECPSLDLCCYNSLSSLRITGWKFSSLPFSLHLFTHLKSLDLSDCPGLESFPMGGFPSNLTDLYITYCPSLESLPEEGLPNSLSTLSIRDCPLLEEKYKKEGGERWHTISHIPIVWIDNVRQHLSD